MQPSSAIPFPKLPSEIYTQIGDTARRFAETRVKPAAQDLDETERFPAEIYAEMAELGLFGITVPEEFGGAGLDTLSYALVMEELARGYASVADQCGLVELIGTLLSVHGNPVQREAYLADVLAARKRVSYCITEAEAGT
ncbi:MAG: acyl-CoA dehydrogenase family protein, partial [Aestuariivirga sp.]